MAVVAGGFSLQAAEAFVLAEGTTLQRSAWKAALGYGPVEVLVFELEPHLDAQGVWSGLVPGGELASAIAALRLLGLVNLGEDIFEVGQRTLARLSALRADDGSWDADGPWPGEGEGLVRKAWYTAALGMGLPRLTGNVEPAETGALAEAAADWLDARWAEVALAGPALWWATLGCAGERPCARDAAARLLEWLDEPRPASDLAWVHGAAVLAGLGANEPLRPRAWQQLAAGQQADGGWAGGSAAGWPVDRVEATLHATRAVFAN